MADAKNYAVRIGDRIAEVEWSGPLSPADLAAALQDVAKHEAFRTGMALLLIDHTSATKTTAKENEVLVRTLIDGARNMDRHVAMVVESEFHYELGMSFAEAADRHGMVLMPFRDLGTARQWIVAQMSDSHYYPVPPEVDPRK